MIVLADTNILLDVLAARQPFLPAAQKVWELCELHRITGVVSAISFNNVYYIVRKAEGPRKARECLRRIRAIFQPVGVDERILEQAMNSPIHDFEDAIQYFSALRAGADCLVTRNPADFPARSAVSIITADAFVRRWNEQAQSSSQ